MFDVVEFIRFQNKDCLYYKNIYSLQSTQHPSYEDCSKWCNDNIMCGGYTVYNTVCYFKSKNCKNNLFKNNGRSTFIIQGGKFIKITFWC